jgi:membrane protein implicated in regulation of membrane protease activity
MAWWVWVLAGIALLVIELATPGGLFALFFGAGALVVAAAAAVGATAPWQWALFTVVSLALLAVLRRPLQERLAPRGRHRVDELVGQEVVVLRDAPAGGEGQAELRGVPWIARAADGAPLRVGQRCRVERVDGVTLWVRAEARAGGEPWSS